MSRYRIKFLLETSLSSETDVEFTYKSHVINLLFSQRINDRRICLATVVEDVNWSSAINTAEKVISPVLDAISLHYKVDMMLHAAVEVVKAESGDAHGPYWLIYGLTMFQLFSIRPQSTTFSNL